MTKKNNTNMSLREDIKARAKMALKEEGYFSGINGLTGLAERALEELMDRNHVPRIFEKEKVLAA